MKITPDLFLAKLAADPKIAAEFDAIHPNMSRRDHCVKVLNLVENTIAFNKASKAKLAAARARIVALERVQASMPATRAALATAQAKASRQSTTPKAPTRSTPTAAKAATARPYEQETTQNIVLCLRRKYVTGQQAIDAAAELARRGVSIDKTSYSTSHI